MKRRILFFGSLCVVLALGVVFIGCDPLLVEFPSMPSPDNVSATVTIDDSGHYSYYVSWAGVSDASSYTIVFVLGGYDDKTPTVLNSYNTRYVRDKCSSYVSFADNNLFGSEGRFGVIANSNRKDRNPSSPGFSDIILLPYP